MIEGDKYSRNRQKVYDLLKENGYTDKELGGNADSLFSDRNNASLAYQALSRDGYSSLANDENDFMSLLYGPDGEKPHDNGIGQDGRKSGFARLRSAFQRTAASPVEDETRQDGGDDDSMGQKPKRALGPRLQSVFRKFGERLDEEVDLEAEPVKAQDAAEEIEELEKQLAEIRGDEDFVKQYDDMKSAVSQQAKSFGNLRGDVRGSAIETEFEKFNADRSWLEENAERYEGAKADKAKADEIRGRIAEITRAEEKRKVEEARRAAQEKLNPQDIIALGIRPNGRDNAGRTHDDYAHFGAADDLLGMAEQEYNRGSKYDPGYGGGTVDKVGTAIGQFVKGGINAVDKGTLTMGLSEAAAFKDVRKVAEKNNDLVNGVFKRLGYDDAAARKVISEAEEAWEKLQPVYEELNPMAAELKDMEATLEALAKSGNEEKYRTTYDKYKKKYEEYSKLYKEKYEPLQHSVDKYTDLMDAVQSATEEGLSESEKAVLDAFGKYVSAKAWGDSNASVASRSGEGLEQTFEFMLDFILTRGVEKAGTKAATKMMANGTLKKYLGETGAKIASKGLADIGVGTVRTSLMFPRSLAAYGEQITQMDRKGSGVDEFGRYKFDRSKANAAVNTALTQFIEYWSEGFGEYFSAGERALFRKVTKNAPKVAIGQTLKNYRGSVGKYLDYGKFDGHFNEMLEEVAGSGLNALAGWMSGDRLGDKEAMKEFWGGENLAVLNLSFLPLSVIGVATNMKAYHRMKSNYDRGVATLNPLLENGSLDRKELEDLTSRMPEMTPEQIRDKIVEITDSARKKNGGSLPDDFAPGLMGVLEGTFAMNMQHDAWRDAAENIAVANAYADYYEDPDAAGSKAWELARNEQAARDAALEAGFTEEDLDEDSAVLARESGSMKEEDPDRASVLYDYAYAKAQSDGLRDGYDNASEEYFSEIESAIRNNEVDGNVIRATDAEGNVVFITSQDATVDSQGLNTPTGRSGLVSYLTPEGNLAQAKADSFTDATSTPTGEYVAAQRQNFMSARDEWFNIVRESISPEGMVAEIGDHVGRTVYVDANGTLAPVRIERTLDNGGTAVISGDKKVLGGIARATGFLAPEGTMMEVPATQLYSLLAREDDNSLMTDMPSAEENATVAPAAEPAQADAAPEMDVQDLRGSYQNIRDIDGQDREVFVTDVRDNGDVVYEYEDENGRTRQNVLPGGDFVSALQENQAPATEAPVAPESTQAPSARQEAVPQSDFRGNPIPMKDGQVDQESFRESDPEAWARWVESLPEGDERRPSLGTAKRLEGIAKSAKKAVEKAQKELEKLYDEGASDEKIQAKEKELRGLTARQRLYDDAVRNLSQPAAEAPVVEETPTPEQGVTPAAEAPVAEEPAPAPDVEESNVSGENFEQDITQPEKTPNHPARLREAYESGNANEITEAQNAIRELINGSEDIDRVNTTAEQAKTRRKKAEKGSAEYKTNDFIAKAASARVKQLRDAGMRTFAERRDAAMEVYFNLDEASESQLRNALAYFESQSQYEADRGRAEEVRRVLDERSRRESDQLTDAQKNAIASIEGKSPEQVAAEHEAERQKPLKERVREWEERTGVTMEVLESRDQVTNKSAQQAIDEGRNPTGWFEPNTGKVVIYLPNVKDVSEIDKTYMHEVVSHKGLRELLGEEGFNSLMDTVWNDLMSEGDRSKWLAYNSHLSGNEEYLRRAAADEFVAHVAENLDADTQNSVWDRIIEKVKEILNKIGLDIRLTDEDIKSLLRSSLANYEKIQAERKAEAEKQKVEQSETPTSVDEEKPKRAATKRVQADKKIDDFGQKIGGARKDQARERIKDSTKLTVKDLSELKDPDKILSRKQIAKYVAEGQMTSADAQTLLATNMAVRSSSGFESYKSLLLVKYRDMASAWERGEDIGFEITQEDEDFILSQYSERIQQMPTIRESIRKSLAYHAQCFEDYRRTYEALDYPNTARDIKSAYISQGRVDGRFWVKGSYSASRGYPFSTFDEAVVKMKSLYPEKVNVDKEAKKAKDSGDSKTGHLKVVKDDYGYYRVKSNLIPGQIFLSRKFYNRKDAEAYLNDNAEALVEKENKMAYALMGSNIGMVQREGQDYRKGKDITEKDFMETFNPRGVEFGNWVPQAERQEYLNKTYDAIMDFCQVVGISPKAFFLGGRLGIAFGSRGKGGALAHYESMKEVINLTRMKGAGSLAHEWFHALDNYLAKRKTGNVSDMATDTRNVERQEVADAFTDFVRAMNALDYTRRSHRAGAYWGEVWERAARLFADYTYNELGGKGIVSPLLARMPDEVDETQEDFILSVWPYATKQENATMKPYFDRLFAAIQEEEGTGVLFRKDGDVKQQQLDIINESNPMTDDYHTGIRSVDDIKTWDEAVAQARQEAEQGGWTELASYPDITNEMVNEAQESGRITVYSSYPIENGVFVTPSRMQAKDYAGEGEVYSKTIPVTNVAWINTDEGQYAETDRERDDAAEDTRFRKANQTQNGFISNAEMALDKIKMEKATPEQWVKMLEKEGGLKAGEDKWLGLSDWLKESDKKTLTKDEIGDFIEQNRIQIDEEHYGEADVTELQREFDEIYDGIINGIGAEDEDEVIMSPRERAWEELNSRYHGGDDFNSAFYLDDRMRIQVDNEDAAGFFLGKKPINYTRLNYTTEGLTNKQEIALTVPTIDPWNESDEIHFGDAGNGRAVAWVRFGDTNIPEDGGAKRAEFERIMADNDRWYNEHPEFAKYGIGDEAMNRESDERTARQRTALAEANAVPNSKKVLVIDEIQSKRHQDAREHGYRDDKAVESATKKVESAKKEYDDYIDSLKEKYGGYDGMAGNLTEEENKRAEDLNEAVIAAQNEEAKSMGGIPSAPFEKNWHELAMKRMLRLAAEEGYDYVAWTTGAQQADRYNMESAIGKLYASKDGEKYYVEVYDPNGNEITFNGLVGDSRSSGTYTPEELVKNFGKEAAKEIIASADALPSEEAAEKLREKYNASGTKEDRDAWRKASFAEIDGSELFKGEGMKGFYDDILPRFMNKYGKKWGVKVSDINLPNVEKAAQTMHAVPVTPEMKESVMEGQVMFREGSAMTEDGETISYESMGGLPEGTKRTSLVERTYKKTGAFSFTGKNKIESAADVAYIFKELETEAVENSFIVFVKDGKPTILHTGIGDITSTTIDSAPMVVGMKDFAPDEVYMVHNHPSGRVEASKADWAELGKLQKIAGETPVQGVIIDTVTGEYGVFDTEYGGTLALTDERKHDESENTPLEVLSFNKMVFSDEYKAEIKGRRMTSAEEVAAYLSAHRLGEGSKVGALLVDRKGMVTGNLVFNGNYIDKDNAHDFAGDAVDAAIRSGAERVILFGDFDYSRGPLSDFRQALSDLSGGSVRLTDAVKVDGNHTRSLAEGTLRDGDEESVMEGQTMFRVAPESQKLFDAAKERFGTTRDIREAGYVLPDGTMLDFSGRHWTSGGDNSWLNGMRQVDHREISDLEFERDGNTPTGIETDMSDFIRRGAIRISYPGAINLYTKPTAAQRSVLARLISSDNRFVRVDFGDGSRSDHYADYDRARPDRILYDIDSYFDDGIKPEGQTLFRVDSDGESETLFRVREGEAPKKTQKVYKLMRLENGKLYPLFIDRDAEAIELSTWYDADSPDLAFLKKMPAGVFLVDAQNGTYTSLEDYKRKRGEKVGKLPSKADVEEASRNGLRWMKITETDRAQRRYDGENRKYENIGINGSEGVSTFAMRPGWHAGSLPTMRQIGKGAEKNLRDDKFVWVEGEIPADVDYNEEAQGNPDKDIPTHIPTDGFYMKATNANKKASQADRVGWYVAGAFKPNRIMSDSEARQVIDAWNAEHQDASVEYDWPRESGREFNADTMSLEEGFNTYFRVDGTEEDRISYAEREATGVTLGRMGDGLGVKIRRIGSASMPAGHKTDKGYYDPSTGEMAVCTDNVTDERDAIATVLHETVGYKGLEDLFGDRFREAMANIYATLDRKGRAWVNGYISQNSLDFGSEGVTRGVMEYVSNLADSGNYNDPVWDSISGILGRVVDANFGTDGFTFTNREMDYVIRAATEHMKNPDWLNTPTGRALDTLMKRQLGINETDPNRPTDPDGPGTGILFRDGDTGVANEDYNTEMELWHNVAVMENQNADLPVKIGMEKVMKEVGMDTLAEEDDYLTRHNVASSRAQTEAHNFELFRFIPLLVQMRAILAKLLGRSSNKGERRRAYERILDYLYAVSALERNAYKNTDLDSSEQRDWSGITSLMGRSPEEWQEAEDDAREMIDSFRSEVNDDAALDALWGRIRACTDFSLEHAYKHGLITRDEYETLHGTASKPRMWNYYLPLRGFDEKTAEETYNYTSFFGTSSQNPVVKKMKGRWTKADNPLANILNIAENEIVQGNDNWAKQALYSFTLNAGENTLLTEATPWFVKDPATNKWMLAEPAEGQTLEDFEKNMQETFNDEHANGLPHTVKKGRRGLSLDKIMVNKANRNEHLIRLKVAGVDKMIWVNGNPALAKAVNGFRRSQSMQQLRRASRALSNLFTTYSLDFTVKNLIRDTIYSRIALIVKEDRAYRNQFRKNWWSNFGYGAFAFPMAKLAFAWESGALQSKPAADRTKREQMFIDFMTDGGQTGYTMINSVNEIKRSLERSMRRAAQETGQVTIPVLGHYAKFVKTVNEAFELLTRFTAYETSRDMGRSGLRSAEDAKEISVNFNRRGAQSGEGIWGNIASYLGATHYFYNAGIQGFDNYLRLYKASPVKMTAITTGLAMMGILTPMINSLLAGAAAGGDGDDDWYWNLPEWVRRNNLILGTGRWYLAVPLPVEFRAPYGLGDIIGSAFVYEKTPNRTFGGVAGDIISTASGILPVNPIEGYTSNGNIGDAVIRGIVPDATVFFVDWATNRDYTGRPLWKENPFSDTAPKSQGAFASTPKGIVYACQKLAEITEGGIDVPPGLVRDFMNNYGGGFFRTAEDISKLLFTDVERPRRWDNIPFFSGFTGHIDEDRSNSFAMNALNEYKDLADGIVKKMNAINGTSKISTSMLFGDPDNLPEQFRAKVNTWKALHPKEYELGRMYNEGMNNKYKMKQYVKGQKKGQWYKSKELERPGVTALKKEWKSLREEWANMPSGTEAEKSAKAEMWLEVQDAWHRYYDAEANLAEALMDYEYGR